MASLNKRERMVACWFAKMVWTNCHSKGTTVKLIKETPYAAELPNNVFLLGTPDLVVIFESGDVFIHEYKTGQGAVDTSDINLQVQGYAWTVAKAHKVEKVVANILSAGETEHNTWTEYNADELANIGNVIRGIAEDIIKPDAPRAPGPDQCKYCKAAGTQFCPESTALVKKMEANAQALEAVDAVFGKMTPEQRGAGLLSVMTVSAVCQKVLAAAKTLLEREPDGIAGWRLAEGRKRRVIEDAAAAYGALAKAGWELPAEEFALAVKVSASGLEDVLYAHEKTAGQKVTRKQVKENLNTVLADCMEWKQDVGSLKRVKDDE